MLHDFILLTSFTVINWNNYDNFYFTSISIVLYNNNILKKGTLKNLTCKPKTLMNGRTTYLYEVSMGTDWAVEREQVSYIYGVGAANALCRVRSRILWKVKILIKVCKTSKEARSES